MEQTHFRSFVEELNKTMVLRYKAIFVEVDKIIRDILSNLKNK
jgi:hypothetical protein